MRTDWCLRIQSNVLIESWKVDLTRNNATTVHNIQFGTDDIPVVKKKKSLSVNRNIFFSFRLYVIVCDSFSIQRKYNVYTAPRFMNKPLTSTSTCTSSCVYCTCVRTSLLMELEIIRPSRATDLFNWTFVQSPAEGSKIAFDLKNNISYCSYCTILFSSGIIYSRFHRMNDRTVNCLLI